MIVTPNKEFNELLNAGSVFNVVVESGSVSAVGTLNNEVIFNETILTSRVIGAYEHDVQFKIFSLGGVASVEEVLYKQEITIAKTKVKNTCVIFGDSITAQNTANTAGFLNNSDRGYFNWANAYLGQRLELVKNAGISGHTTTQMLARLNADVLAFNAGYVFVLGGYNDIVNGVSWKTTAANLESIYTQIINNGGIVIALALQPSTTFNTTARREALTNINLWIRNYATRNGGVLFVDTYTPFLDPTNASGGSITSMQVDAIHPSTLGAQRLGKQIFNRLDKLTPIIEMQSSIADIASPTNPYGNMILNPVMGGTGGLLQTGASGSVADNWNALIAIGTATSVESKVARTDYPNMQWQQSVITNTTGSSTHYLYKGAQSMASAGIVVGDIAYALIELELSTITGSLTVDGINSDLVAVGGTGITSAYALGQANGLIEAGSFVFRTPNFTIPPSTTGLQLNNELKVSGNGTVTIRHGRVELRKVIV